MPFGSPDLDLIRASGRMKLASSRWKEDWEELELLVSCLLVLFNDTCTDYISCMQGKGAFGSVVKARNKIDSRIYAGLSDLSNSPLSSPS